MAGSDDENIIIEDHDPIIEICQVTDPEEAGNKQHSPIDIEPEHLDDRRDKRCPESNDTQECDEDRMNAEECIRPHKREHELQSEQDQTE